MITSPCKNCLRKNLPKNKCISECKLLKEIQEMNLSMDRGDERCGVDCTEVYTVNIPPSLASRIS
jgi:hypothetical protein